MGLPRQHGGATVLPSKSEAGSHVKTDKSMMFWVGYLGYSHDIAMSCWEQPGLEADGLFTILGGGFVKRLGFMLRYSPAKR